MLPCRTLLLLSLLPALACSVDTKLPAEAQLTCAAAADCPAEFICNTTLGRCVPRGGEDAAPPALASPLAPSLTLLRTGTTTTLEVHASEPLALPPVVTLEAPGVTPRALTLEPGRTSSERFTFTYAASGDEPEGVDVPVRVLLIDRAGNQASFATALRFDRTAPRLEDVVVTGLPARRDGVVRVSFSASEDLEGTPSVRRAGGGSPLVSVGPPTAGRTYVFEGSATGTEPAVDDLLLGARDRAGNTVELRVPAALTFDFTAPAVVQSEVPTPHVREGFSAIARVTLSEPLRAPPTLHLVPRAGGPALTLALADQAGASFTFSRRVEAADAPGTYDVALVACEDRAGNACTAATLGSLQLDKQGPALTSGPTLNRSPAAYAAGALLELDFAVSEDLGAAPDVRLGSGAGRALACTEGAPRAFHCTLTVAPAQDAEGPAGLSIGLTDRAGNQAFAATTVTLDYTAPTVAESSTQLWLVPTAANPVQAGLTSVTTGTTVRLSFGLTEPTPTEPTVVATQGGSVLPFTRQGGAGLVYAHTLGAGTWAQGAYAVAVTARDAAGNQATSTLALPAPGLTVDTVAPAAPLLSATGLVFHRLPWGRLATQGVRDFYVDGGPGSAEAGALLRLLDGAGAGAGELSRGTVASNGAVAPQSAGGVDRTTVWAQVVDLAGNTSPTLDVREVEWVATLAGKQPGSTLENPTRLVATPRFLPMREPGEATEPAAEQLQQLAATPGVGASFTSARTWRRVSASLASPSARVRGAMTTDLARGKVVLFGASTEGVGDDTWELDLATNTWTQRDPAGAIPAPRARHRMAYDARRGKVLLFGGEGHLSNVLADVWEWDGANGTWTLLEPATAARPAGRASPQVTFDERRGRLLVFGGDALGTFLDDVWEFDPATRVWLDRTPAQRPAGAWPGARSQAAFVYDAGRGVALLAHGGNDPDFFVATFDDVWEWDGAAGTWQNRTTTPRPAMLAEIAAVYDPRRARVVLHGGYDLPDDTHVYSNQLFEWNGTAWTNRTPATGSPALGGHSAAYDPVRGAVLLFGGLGSWEVHAATHAWLGAEGRFVELTPAPEPASRSRAAATYDPHRQVVYLFGGQPGSGPSNDLWEYDAVAGRWRNLTPSPLPASWPPARYAHGMAYDPAGRRVLVYGGVSSTFANLTDLWSYEPTSRTWTRPAVSGTPPSARSRPAVAFHAARGELVVFGGYGAGYLGDTYAWNATSGAWSLRASGGPPARSGAGLDADPVRGTLLLFGGANTGGRLSDVWEWSGTAWAQRTSTSTPPLGREGAQVAFDTQRGELLVQGGNCGWNVCTGAESNRLWRFTPGGATPPLTGTWTADAADPAVPSYNEGFAAYDSGRGRLIMGGSATSGSMTWEYSNGAADRPAALWQVPFGAARATGATLTSVQVTADAGGRGSTPTRPATAVAGAQLYAWNATAGEWRTVALPNAAAPNAAVSASRRQVTFTSAASIAELRQGAQDTFTFALAPVQEAGVLGPPGEVWVDGLELVVRYRR